MAADAVRGGREVKTARRLGQALGFRARIFAAGVRTQAVDRALGAALVVHAQHRADERQLAASAALHALALAMLGNPVHRRELS